MAATVTLKCSKTLYGEMEGGGYAQGNEGEEAEQAVWRFFDGKQLDLFAAKIVLDAVESQRDGMEAIAGSGLAFEEARDLAAARRSAETVARKLREFIEREGQ